MHAVSGKVFFFFLVKVRHATFVVRLTKIGLYTIIPSEKLQSFQSYSKSVLLFFGVFFLAFVYSKIPNISAKCDFI